MRASGDIEEFQNTLKSGSDIVPGYWVGTRNGGPYTMAEVEKGKCRNSEKLMSDKLGKCESY